MIRIHKIIASGFGTGYVPIAPGTAGSILGILLFYLINQFEIYLGWGWDTTLLVNAGIILFVTLIGVNSIKNVHQVWGHDASAIVIDEIVGVWIAVFAMPHEWKYYLIALILFRFFDIAKPLFIRRLDKMYTNWSVMLDDILAGVYSLIVIQVLYELGII
jgi:phosphatidylglycerophosphatase A